MNVWKYLLALALLVAVRPAGAQIGIYFNPIGTHVSESAPDSGVLAFLGQGVSSRTFGGVSMGGYYTFLTNPSLKVALDVRDELEHGNSAALNSFLVGAHISGRPGHPLQPYLQLSGGAGTSRSPLSPARQTRAMFKVYGGLDYAFSKHVDFRAIEVGYGTLSVIGSGTFGGAGSTPSVSLLSFSSGLVFRFR